MTDKIKYPKTYHLPWSDGRFESRDELVLEDAKGFFGTEVVVTEKMDGSNLTMYSDYLHSRSLETSSHPSFDWVKKLHADIKHLIPSGWRICGENLYARHSIHYQSLSDYFLVFSIWNEDNLCLSWDDTVVWADLIGLQTVPVLYYGMFNEKKIRNLYPEPRCEDREGYVIRRSNSFFFGLFSYAVAKYVRKDHIALETEHWRSGPLILNQLGSTKSNEY